MVESDEGDRGDRGDWSDRSDRCWRVSLGVTRWQGWLGFVQFQLCLRISIGFDRVQQGSTRFKGVPWGIDRACKVWDPGSRSLFNTWNWTVCLCASQCWGFFFFTHSTCTPAPLHLQTTALPPVPSPPVSGCQVRSLLSVTGWPGADRAGKDTNSYIWTHTFCFFKLPRNFHWEQTISVQLAVSQVFSVFPSPQQDCKTLQFTSCSNLALTIRAVSCGGHRRSWITFFQARYSAFLPMPLYLSGGQTHIAL